MSTEIVSASDIRWLIAVRDFNKNYENWEKDPLKANISTELFTRIDLLFQTIRRAIDTRSYTPENRMKVYQQIEMLSFLSGFADVELGKSPDQLFL